jgi:hypothetical protein
MLGSQELLRRCPACCSAAHHEHTTPGSVFLTAAVRLCLCNVDAQAPAHQLLHRHDPKPESSGWTAGQKMAQLRGMSSMRH